MTPVAGQFWRSVFAMDVARVLDGGRWPEGRYHHDGSPALDMSPSPEHSRVAIDADLRPDDAPRVMAPFDVRGALLADLRAPNVQRASGLNGGESCTLWQPGRTKGQSAANRIASDAARRAGAGGIIYAARSAVLRWHIELFLRNTTCGPQVRQSGSPIPF